MTHLLCGDIKSKVRHDFILQWEVNSRGSWGSLLVLLNWIESSCRTHVLECQTKLKREKMLHVSMQSSRERLLLMW